VKGARPAALVLVAAAFAASLAPTAEAATKFAGHLTGYPQQKVSFTRSSGSVTKFTLKQVAVVCDGGTQHINPVFGVNAPIGTTGHFKAVGGPVTFKGTITGNSAKGTLIVDGSFSGSSQNCHADKAWTAAI
jgi:hypothetical protein